ncbi:hypothetical protein OR1_02242 [Geobacter sp. OR-1]|uniref:OmpL47-type beta-barrel domain-containing protein n=1 Tax=Geobacter sp. OR-1 TaxID=1266765 RepID=UPI0005430ECD|nr:hypothetical protein [Geobacter sp. OR-1]GAM09957.1 hypothetical protein OR1_02242 [Geobacter sp. OR-1]
MSYSTKMIIFPLLLLYAVISTNTVFAEPPPQPVITLEISGVMDSGVYANPVTPQIRVLGSDANFEAVLNNAPYDFKEISSEGEYQLDVSAVDKTGKPTKRSVKFVIDRTAPVTTANINPPKHNSPKAQFLSYASTIELSAEDSGPGRSGIDRIEYHFGDATEWKSFHEPIELNLLSRGPHILSFRAIDKAGNTEQTKILSFVLDTTPPKSKIEIGTPIYKNSDGKSFVSGATAFTITANDEDSGLAQTEYRIDGKGWLSYREAFRIEDEGEHKIEFRSSDNVGNIEDIQSINIAYDSTPPITDLSTDDKKDVSSEILYTNKPLRLLISATDMLSGVNKSEYRIDQGPWQLYSPFTVDDKKNHLVSFRSSDNVNNMEITKSVEVHIDKTPPVTKINIGSPSLNISKGHPTVNDSTFFYLEATDNQSGVSRSEYRVDTGEWSPYEPFTIQDGGKHSIEFRSIDKAGNMETARSMAVMVDTDPPTSMISIDHNKTEYGDTIYSVKPVNLSLSAIDSEAGVKTSQYKLDDGPWKTYQPFSISDEGIHLVEFRSVDQLDNAEPTRFVKIIIDHHPPVTSLMIGEPKQPGQEQVQITDKTVLSLSANDELSGAAKSEYVIIGKGMRQGSEPFTISTPGEYEIRYWSMDRAGNREPEKVSHIKVVIPPPPPPVIEDKSTQGNGPGTQIASGQRSDSEIPESIRMTAEPIPLVKKEIKPETKPIPKTKQNPEDETYLKDHFQEDPLGPGEFKDDFGKSHTKEYLGIGGINALIITIIFLIL